MADVEGNRETALLHYLRLTKKTRFGTQKSEVKTADSGFIIRGDLEIGPRQLNEKTDGFRIVVDNPELKSVVSRESLNLLQQWLYRVR